MHINHFPYATWYRVSICTVITRAIIWPIAPFHPHPTTFYDGQPYPAMLQSRIGIVPVCISIRWGWPLTNMISWSTSSRAFIKTYFMHDAYHFKRQVDESRSKTHHIFNVLDSSESSPIRHWRLPSIGSSSTNWCTRLWKRSECCARNHWWQPCSPSQYSQDDPTIHVWLEDGPQEADMQLC